MNLQEALADFKQRALSVPDIDSKLYNEIPPTSRLADWHKGNETPGNFVNLRLDWELALKEFVEYDDISEIRELPGTNEKVWDLMLLQMEADLGDLIENGDSQGSTDPLLMAIDGERVRSKKLSHVEIAGGRLFREYKPRKETIEYTLYITMYTEFE